MRDSWLTPHETLDGARAGTTVYLAVRSTDNNTGRSYVFAAVILIRNSKKDGFGYKDQDEGMGPHQYDCPQRIMRLLSPIADLPHARYSADWRTGVAAWHDQNRNRRQRRNSLRVGNVVTVEPGVYLPERFGVRIEDLVIVRAEGGESLSGLSKELTEVS